MVKSKVTTVVAVLLIVFHVALTAERISYDDFLQCFEDAVVSNVASENTDEGSSNLQVSSLPSEILHYWKEELYENQVLKDFATTSKDELTKILTNDVKTRHTYFETNKKVFETFLMRVLQKDLKNYPDENSGLDPLEIHFLSMMTNEAVDEIIKKTIVDKQAPLEESWKVLSLKDSFRTVFYYCKYPKELAVLLTKEMRDEVKEWLDSTATWGKWGFESDDSEPSIKLDNLTPLNLDDAPLKLEL